MKALFIGGIKSGKSKNAEEYTLENTQNTKPLYLATTEFIDSEMSERIEKHKLQRSDSFDTIEEPLLLTKAIQQDQEEIVLIECISMWINNMLHHGFTESDMMQQLGELNSQNNKLVFVINDVSCSVVSDNELVRKFVDINGRISQYLASECSEVYNTVAGISVKIK